MPTRPDMRTATSVDLEKLELEAVLASGIFTRAPNLENLLRYVCSKYFDGLAGEIKEYNIAVEALGRPPEFDQKRDSIVRVEAHKLRKRLREDYEKDGADHAIQIEIPPGQYTPHFITVARSAAVVVAESPSTVPDPVPVSIPTRELAVVQDVVDVPSPVAVPAPPPLPRFNRVTLLLVAAVLALGLVAGLALRKQPEPVEKIAVVAPAVVPTGEDVRILAGVESGSYTDVFQNVWSADRYFTGGSVDASPRTHPFRGTGDQEIYKKRREGVFRYEIPLHAGPWELRLHFAEAVFGNENVAGGGEASRAFAVNANGKPLIADLDVIRDVGPGAADIRVFKDVRPGADGKLHLEFQPISNAPFVNAIELVPGVPGRLRPIRWIAHDRGYKDTAGRMWEPDKAALGGLLISRPESKAAGPDPELFRGERYGNLAYVIPVAEGSRYTVNMYFTESWFGKGMPGGGGNGSRVFDILINGMAVRRNLDIYKESGGQGRPLVVTQHSVESNAQGKIMISMPPSRNYACVNAIEVLDESK